MWGRDARLKPTVRLLLNEHLEKRPQLQEARKLRISGLDGKRSCTHASQGRLEGEHVAEVKYEVFQDKRGKYRWRRLASNGRLVGASSLGHNTREEAESNIQRSEISDKWEVYEDRQGRYRWRRLSSSGKLLDVASTSYADRDEAERVAKGAGR